MCSHGFIFKVLFSRVIPNIFPDRLAYLNIGMLHVLFETAHVLLDAWLKLDEALHSTLLLPICTRGPVLQRFIVVDHHHKVSAAKNHPAIRLVAYGYATTSSVDGVVWWGNPRMDRSKTSPG